MPFSNSVHRMVRIGRLVPALAIAGWALAASFTQAVAAEADKPEIGSIIIARDFGPRNALLPEVGVRYRIETAPDPALLAFASTVSAITDAQASEITGTFSSLPDTGLTIQQSLSTVGFGEQVQSNGTVGQSANGIGDTVGGAIAAGMGALGGVLGALPLGGQ